MVGEGMTRRKLAGICLVVGVIIGLVLVGAGVYAFVRYTSYVSPVSIQSILDNPTTYVGTIITTEGKVINMSTGTSPIILTIQQELSDATITVVIDMTEFTREAWIQDVGVGVGSRILVRAYVNPDPLELHANDLSVWKII